MKITDEMLFKHAAEARDIWLSTLPTRENIPEMPCSPSFEKKMRKLIKKQKHTLGTHTIVFRMRQTVAALLLIFLIFFGGFMTVDAYREQVMETVVHIFKELTEYRFSSEIAEETVALPTISFAWIPEGMHEVENKITASNSRYILYEDGDERFFELTQRMIDINHDYGILLDTENSDYEVGQIHGEDAYFNTKDGDSSIIWTRNNIVYHLYGNLKINDLKTIAEKIKIFDH